MDFDDVMLERGYDPMKGYGQSKLAQILHTFDLAGRLEGSQVTVNCLHPVTVMDTKMVFETFGDSMSDVREGADTTLRLITSPDLEVVTGRYFDGQSEAHANAQAYDPKPARSCGSSRKHSPERTRQNQCFQPGWSRMEVVVNGSRYTKEEIARRGREIYERDIRSGVEHDHDGRFLVVDITNGHYEIADDELTAFERAGEKNPGGSFFLLRVGRRAAHRLGGRQFSSAG